MLVKASARRPKASSAAKARQLRPTRAALAGSHSTHARRLRQDPSPEQQQGLNAEDGLGVNEKIGEAFVAHGTMIPTANEYARAGVVPPTTRRTTFGSSSPPSTYNKFGQHERRET
jgi:hypothetical protein